MNMKWLKTFIVSANYENFRKASEELYLTQPAISKHIQRLEEYLNIQLFERKGKTIALTPAGNQFLFYAKEIMFQYEQGMDRFESWKQGYQQKLTIATAPQIASSFLPSLLRVFTDENNEIEVLINVIKSFEIGDEVSTGRADLGLTRVQPLQKSLHTSLVYEEPVILVGAKSQKNMSESDVLASNRLITHNHPDYWDSLLNDVKKHYPNVRTMVVNQVEVSKKFIEQGLGVSYLPVSMVEEELANNRLVKIAPEKVSTPTSTTYVLTKVETNESKKFIEFLRATI